MVLSNYCYATDNDSNSNNNNNIIIIIFIYVYFFIILKKILMKITPGIVFNVRGGFESF